VGTRISDSPVNRGRLYGVALGLCLGLALLLAPAALATSPANVTGQVQTVVPDGSGGYYVGGLFSVTGDATFQNVGAAHILSDGTVDATFDPLPNGSGGTVNAIALSSSYVYLGGNFTIGGVSYVARVDNNPLHTTTYKQLDTTWPPIRPDRSTHWR
jgi:hypothetical protein